MYINIHTVYYHSNTNWEGDFHDDFMDSVTCVKSHLMQVHTFWFHLQSTRVFALQHVDLGMLQILYEYLGWIGFSVKLKLVAEKRLTFKLQI